MLIAVVSSQKCIGHDACPARKVCPTKALIQLDPGETVVVSGSNCMGCGDCVPACPQGAIALRQM